MSEPPEPDLLTVPGLRELAYDSYLLLAYDPDTVVSVDYGQYCDQYHWARQYLVGMGQESLLSELFERASTPEGKLQGLLGLRELHRLSREDTESYLRTLSVNLQVHTRCDCPQTKENLTGDELSLLL